MEDVVRKPGAIHRARFMASCLYLLKIFLYREQLDADDITYEELCDVEILAEYVALLHMLPIFFKLLSQQLHLESTVSFGSM